MTCNEHTCADPGSLSENPLYPPSPTQVLADNEMLVLRVTVEVTEYRKDVEELVEHPVSDADWRAFAEHLDGLPYTFNTDRISDDLWDEMRRFFGGEVR